MPAPPPSDDGPVLFFTPEEWDAFLAGAHKGEFDSFEALGSITERITIAIGWRANLLQDALSAIRHDNLPREQQPPVALTWPPTAQ
jgi:Domain of unknown function (DUF397)